MVIKHDILAEYHLTDAVKSKILDYILNNLDNLYTVSLRTAIKLAEIYRLNPTGWRKDADVAFLRHSN
jgi:hypothetical protein